MTEPLKTEFGFYGETIHTDEVIQEQRYDSSHLNKYVRDFLQVCATTERDEATKLTRSPDEFRDSWNKMSEKTSSHGKLHFGHYKAGVKNTSVLMTHYILAEIPFRSGYSLKRWKKQPM